MRANRLGRVSTESAMRIPLLTSTVPARKSIANPWMAPPHSSRRHAATRGSVLVSPANASATIGNFKDVGDKKIITGFGGDVKQEAAAEFLAFARCRVDRTYGFFRVFSNSASNSWKSARALTDA